MIIYAITKEKKNIVLTNVAHIQKAKEGYEIFFLDGSEGIAPIKRIATITDSMCSGEFEEVN